MKGSPLVELISGSSPQILDGLREKHPEASSLLSITRTRKAGDGTEDAEESIAVARRDLLLEGIPPLRKELDAVIRGVVQKMKMVKRTKTLGAVVATLSGLVIAISEASNIGDEWIKAVSAAFATIGGLVVILSDYFAQAPNGRYIASAEEYGKLDQMAKEVFKLEQRVKRYALFPLSEEDVAETINSLEEYAAHINGLTLIE